MSVDKLIPVPFKPMKTIIQLQLIKKSISINNKTTYFNKYRNHHLSINKSTSINQLIISQSINQQRSINKSTTVNQQSKICQIKKSIVCRKHYSRQRKAHFMVARIIFTANNKAGKTAKKWVR